MENPRLSFPAKGWATLRFGDQPTPELQARVLQAAVVPGARHYPEAIELPRSMWRLDTVTSLLDVANIKDHERVRLGGVSSPSLADLRLSGGQANLLPHQVEAVGHALQSGGLLLADEMGLGKTRVAIVTAETVASDVGGDRCRLIVGPRFARAVWRDELLRVGAITDVEREFCALESFSLDDPSWRPDAKWYFIHYELGSTWWSRFNTMGARRPCICIVDEIHWLKNPRTRRSKAAHALAGPVAFRMGLTGTPLSNRPNELWSPLTLVAGPGSFGTFTQFRMRYCGGFTQGGHIHDGDPSHVDELQLRLQGSYLRREIKDIDLELPPLQRRKIEVAIDPSTAAAQRDFLHGLQIREIVRAIAQNRAGRDTLTLLGRLRKLTSAAKVSHTVEYVRGLFEEGRSAVIFCWERATAEKLAKRLDSWCVHGGISQELREATVAGFQLEEARVATSLVATFDSLKEGVTLTRADVVVMHDLDWVPSNVLQAEKRVHRIGQGLPVTSAWMIALESIDTIMADVILLKAAHIEEMMGIDAPRQLVDDLDLSTVAYDAMNDFVERLDRWRRSA